VSISKSSETFETHSVYIFLFSFLIITFFIIKCLRYIKEHQQLIIKQILIIIIHMQ